jgi:hypothetical protein
VQQQGERRREEGLAAKLRAAQLLDARRAARHAREAALDAARRREWRAARLAAVVRATSKLAAGLAAARQLRAARARMQHAEEAVVVIQKCWRVRGLLLAAAWPFAQRHVACLCSVFCSVQ